MFTLPEKRLTIKYGVCISKMVEFAGGGLTTDGATLSRLYTCTMCHVYMYTCIVTNIINPNCSCEQPSFSLAIFTAAIKVGRHNAFLLLKRTVWLNSKVIRLLQSSLWCFLVQDLLLDLLNVYFFDKTAVWTFIELQGPRILSWKCWDYKLVLFKYCRLFFNLKKSLYLI